MWSVSTEDRNAPINQTTDEPATKNMAENTDLSAAEEMKRDSTIVRKMKETLAGSGSKECHDVSATDALRIDSQKEEPIICSEKNIAPYSVGFAACGLNEPFEEILRNCYWVY